MELREYRTKYDSLAAEDALFDIPLRKEYLLESIGRGKRVLDVGCLGGRISELISERNNQVWGVFLVTGLDRIFDFVDDLPTGLASLQLG